MGAKLCASVLGRSIAEQQGDGRAEAMIDETVLVRSVDYCNRNC